MKIVHLADYDVGGVGKHLSTAINMFTKHESVIITRHDHVLKYGQDYLADETNVKECMNHVKEADFILFHNTVYFNELAGQEMPIGDTPIGAFHVGSSYWTKKPARRKEIDDRFNVVFADNACLELSEGRAVRLPYSFIGRVMNVHRIFKIPISM